MKRIIIIMLLNPLWISCSNSTQLTEKEKKEVESEIHQFIEDFSAAGESLSSDKLFDFFMQNEEFAIASQGVLITNPMAAKDTISTHLAMMTSQSIKPVQEKILVINKDAAVVSLSAVANTVFKNGYEAAFPYALTMLVVKRDGKWKIAHYHN